MQSESDTPGSPYGGAADRFAHSAWPGNLELKDEWDDWDGWDIWDVQDVQEVWDVWDVLEV